VINKRGVPGRGFTILPGKKIAADHFDSRCRSPTPDEFLDFRQFTCWSCKTHKIAESIIEQTLHDVKSYESGSPGDQDAIISGYHGIALAGPIFIHGHAGHGSLTAGVCRSRTRSHSSKTTRLKRIL